ncbi:Ribonuclease P protein component 3 [Actinacidiphila bryophytorum]|uniref:Ribonuclease P protein component 3 n=1 Tax=Actinacidiphila bryophytorum TaxID=1436133 RepID=A0A9W4EDT4_9ACTN|nr:Ribonuclease P protein component 3 [Actinacidiphila bryophytorum]
MPSARRVGAFRRRRLPGRVSVFQGRGELRAPPERAERKQRHSKWQSPEAPPPGERRTATGSGTHPGPRQGEGCPPTRGGPGG